MDNFDPASIQEFHYRLPWRSKGVYPGHHPSYQVGGGLEFRAHAPLHNHPDPRRLDLRLSLKDPFEQLYVRVFHQRSQVHVYVVADLSASMGFWGYRRKMALLSAFMASVAASAYRTGDPFGFIGCDGQVWQELFLPASHPRLAWQFAKRLAYLQPFRASSQGLCQAVHYLGAKRALVFLVSDFHMPIGLIEAILCSLSRHDLVPVILWDSAEYQRLPLWGLVQMRDLESGQARMLFFRPRLKERLVRAFEERRALLTRLCVTHGREPLFLNDQVEAETLTRYFHQR